MVQHEKITNKGKLLAVIVRNTGAAEPLTFLTPDAFGLQLGIHNRPKGDYVPAHEHVPFENISIDAQEFFYIEQGKVRVAIFDKQEKITEVELGQGEMALLNCGHNITFVEDARLVEIKQGPYRSKEKEKISLE